jgi:hypothetical protein
MRDEEEQTVQVRILPEPLLLFSARDKIHRTGSEDGTEIKPAALALAEEL